jgi:WD40 repeat protein
VYALAVLPGGQLASGSGDYTIRIWNTTQGQCERVLTGHLKIVVSLAVLSDGKLASGSHDGSVRVWDVGTGTCVRVLRGHGFPVHVLAVLPDGDLASGSSDGAVRAWRGDACIFTTVRHVASACRFVVLPNGRLLSSSVGGHVRLWDVVKSECMSIYSRLVGSNVLLHDGTVASSRGIFFGSERLDVWDPASGQTLLTLEGLSADMIASALLPNGQLAAADFNGNICVWK